MKMFPGTLLKPKRKKKLNIFQISDFKSKQNSNKIAEKMGSNPNS
jgi:hypothetical protein